MSNKFTITYKRKRVTSHAHTADGTTLESSGASSSVVARSLAPHYGVGADHMLHEDNFSTSAKQHDICDSTQEGIIEEKPKQSAHVSDKEQNELQLCESLPQKEHTEVYCATNVSVPEAFNSKLQCTNDTNNFIPVSSCVHDLMHGNCATNQTEDSNTSACVGKNCYQRSNDTSRPSQCKSRFSPLLTFQRRVKKKFCSDEPAAVNYSEDSNKQCSTLTCSPPSSLLNATALLKPTGGSSLDIEDKATIAGTSTELSGLAKHLVEQKSSYILNSSTHHMVPTQPADDVNQCLTLGHDGTAVSEFTTVREISEPDARLEDSKKTSVGVIEVPKVVEVKGEGHGNWQTSLPQSPRQKINLNLSKPCNKSEADDLLESQGSTRNIPIIVLDDGSDERGKELEKSEVYDQVIQEKNKSRLSFWRINLNCAELPPERLLSLDESSIQRLQNQDRFGYEHNQMSQPVERQFFTKEKDIVHGKQEHDEGTSTMHNSYSNFFDPAPSSSWNAGKFKQPRSMPSEMKFRIMDKVPEFNLDLRLDSFPDSRNDKLFHGGSSSGSHFLTERLSTYSYKKHSAPWSEEELDFLWIGVRRYGTNNWNAMLRDRRLWFSNSRNAEDLAKQWDKEQKKLLGGIGLFQPIKAAALGHSPASHLSEDHVGSSSWSGCSKPPYLSAQTDLSLGDMYLRSGRASERGQHHISNLGILNLQGFDNAPRNLSLGGFPVASSPYGRNASRRRRASKLHKSYYDNKPLWHQDPSERVSQFLPMNQEPINSLPEWLTKNVKLAGMSRFDSEMWPSTQAPGHSATADRLNDMKPHALPDGLLKRAPKRKAEWRTFSKKLFQTAGDGDLNQRSAAAAIAGPLGATVMGDARASSEETVSDS